MANTFAKRVLAKREVTAKKITLDLPALEFDDSVEATDFMYTVRDLLKSKALIKWAKDTDSNFSVDTLSSLKAAIKAYDKFLDTMEEAGE